MSSEYLGRWILTYDGAIKGSIRLEEGRVVEVCYGESVGGKDKSIVLPSFVNAHVHVGDSIAYPAPKGTVEETVAPPDGYKHKVLRSSSKGKKIAAMRASLKLMRSTGTCAFVDFREEGVDGVKALREALTTASPKATVLGRPAKNEFTHAEVRSLLASCDGIGLSAISDWASDDLDLLSRSARRAGKLFAVHVSEARREDIGAVLDLRPGFVVHMTKATQEDLAACARSRVPVVVCSRSNEFFGLAPDIPRMLGLGVEVALGTDNCMIARPDMLDEIKAAYRLAKAKGGISPLDAVKLATFCGRKVLNVKGKITTEITERDDLVVVRVRGDDPLSELVTSAVPGDIRAMVKGGRIRRT